MPIATPGYLEHLGDGDLAFLAEVSDVSERSVGDAVALLRSRHDLIERALAHPRLYERLFHKGAGSEPLVRASPFLIFAVLIHRCARELSTASYVDEWVGPRRRLPVFDVRALREFVSDPSHRVFLAELLASYTHVASGAVWARDRRGWRRRKLSELDPVRLASLLDVVSEEERPGIYRRLGDVSLFLTGVFPDHSAVWPSSAIEAARLKRVALSTLREPGEKPDVMDEGEVEGVGPLEQLGQRWYRMACATARPPHTYSLRVVAAVAERFREARRILNFLTDHHLFPFRARWYPDLRG